MVDDLRHEHKAVVTREQSQHRRVSKLSQFNPSDKFRHFL